MSAIESDLAALTDVDRNTFEQIIAEFETTWDEKRFTGMVGKLPARGSPLRLPLLVELVTIDLERNWAIGLTTQIDWYLQQYPELGTPESVSLSLILAECRARQHFGETLDLSSFVKRFPNQAEALQLALQNLQPVRTMPQRYVNGTPATPVRPPQGPLVAGQPLKQFDRYQIIRELGRCGMGAVYLVTDERLGRNVALKVPHVTRSDSESLKRFKREAQSAAALQHPNICQIHDVGDWNGIPYLTMNYVNGKPLSDPKYQFMTSHNAVALVRKVATVLAYAHRQGVVHRDVKPHNIMVTDSGNEGIGEPMIIDFGLALQIGTSDPRITASGDMLGTPAYMAPEQVEGKLDLIGAGCDIYSLGVVLYEMLTGQLPIQDPNISELFRKIREQAPVPPSRLRPGLDPRLDAICMKALAKLPKQRHASMNAMVEELTAFLEAEPLVVPLKPARRYWIKWAAGIAAIALLAYAITLTPKWGAKTAPPLPPLALQWSGFAQGQRSGEWLDLSFKDGMTLRDGDQYRLVLVPNEDSFLYVVGVDRNGPSLMFPNDKIHLNNRCQGKRVYQLPPDQDGFFTLDQKTGSETLYLIASHERLVDLENLLADPSCEKPGEKLEAMLQALEKKSSDELTTRGARVEPDRRIAKSRMKNGSDAENVMEFNFGAGYVVKRIRFEHKAAAP